MGSMQDSLAQSLHNKKKRRKIIIFAHLARYNHRLIQFFTSPTNASPQRNLVIYAFTFTLIWYIRSLRFDMSILHSLCRSIMARLLDTKCWQTFKRAAMRRFHFAIDL